MTTRRVAKHEWVEGRLPPDPSGEPDGKVLTTENGLWVPGEAGVSEEDFRRLRVTAGSPYSHRRLVLWDDFDREPGAVGSAPSGQTWQSEGANFQIIDRAASGGKHVSASGYNINSGLVADLETPNVAILLRCSIPDAAASREGIALCYVDEDNYISVNNRGSNLGISMLRNGSHTTLANTFPPDGENEAVFRPTASPPLFMRLHGAIRHNTTGGVLTVSGSIEMDGRSDRPIFAIISDPDDVAFFSQVTTHGILHTRDMRYFDIAAYRHTEDGV